MVHTLKLSKQTKWVLSNLMDQNNERIREAEYNAERVFGWTKETKNYIKELNDQNEALSEVLKKAD